MVGTFFLRGWREGGGGADIEASSAGFRVAASWALTANVNGLHPRF